METVIDNPERPKVYEPIAVELSADDINAVMENYFSFLDLPYEERARIAFQDPKQPRTGWSGYAHKGEAASQDNKHIFHMTQALANKYKSPEMTRLPAETRLFLKTAEEVYYLVSGAAKEKFAEFEPEIPALVGIHFPRSGKREHHLRFIAYQASQDGFLARGHYDKATATIALAESHDGLRLGFGPNNMELIDRDRFEPLYFTGFGWHQLAEILDARSSHRAGWHDVVDTGKRVNEDITRWAMVFFINPAHISYESTEDQTHTPIPWRGLGEIALRSDSRSFLI